MQLIVFGASNALGGRVKHYAEASGHTIVPALREHVQYTDVNSLHDFFKAHDPSDSIVINLAALAAVTSSIPELILINSFFPHLLASVAAHVGLNMLHVSSDSVFSGHNRFKNTIETNAAPTTYYGKSRALGEVLRSNVSILRTSYVGLESGIVKWLKAKNNEEVDGWVNYKWSGSTIDQIAQGIVRIATQSSAPEFSFGVRHLSTVESISKYDVANLLVKKLGLNIKVNPVYYPYMNRSLVPTDGDVLISLEEAMFSDVDNSFTYLQESAARR